MSIIPSQVTPNSVGKTITRRASNFERLLDKARVETAATGPEYSFAEGPRVEHAVILGKDSTPPSDHKQADKTTQTPDYVQVAEI